MKLKGYTISSRGEVLRKDGKDIPNSFRVISEIELTAQELAEQITTVDFLRLVELYKEPEPKEPKVYNEDVIFMCKKHKRVNCGECFEVLPKKLEVPKCNLKSKENLTDVREQEAILDLLKANVDIMGRSNLFRPKDKPKQECKHGYVKNCVIQVRKGDGTLFRISNGDNPVAFLDSYYIIPKEDYEPQPKKIEECGCNPKTTNPMRYNPCSVCGKPLPKFNKIEELDMCIKKAINFDEIVVLKNMQDKINELVRVLNGGKG
jgi:hypothetical protein